MSESGGFTGRNIRALLSICVLVLMVMIQNTSVNMALPKMALKFNASTSQLQWIVDAYTLIFTVLLLSAGYIGDRFGRKKVLMFGVVGFALGSFGAAHAMNLTQLIGLQGFIGLCAACIYPTTLATISAIFTSAKTKNAAIGIWSGVSGLGVAIGPVVSGLLLDKYYWGSVYYINVAVGLLCVLLVIFFIPETRHVGEGGFDFLGFITSIIGIGTLVYAIIEAPNKGWLSKEILILFAISLVSIIAFAIIQMKVKNPLIDTRVFKYRQFTGSVISILLTFFALFGFMFVMSMYFQMVKGYSPLSSGVRLLPAAIVIALISPISTIAAKYMNANYMMSSGFLILGLGFYIVDLVKLNSPYFWDIVVPMALIAMGLSLIQGPASTLVMYSLPPKQAGAGSAVNDTSRELGGTLGVAILGSVLSTSFAHQMSTVLSTFKTLPADIKQKAQDSVTGAFGLVKYVPKQLQLDYITKIKEGYITAMGHAVIVVVIILGVGMVLAFFTLWGVKADGQVNLDDEDENEAEQIKDVTYETIEFNA